MAALLALASGVVFRAPNTLRIKKRTGPSVPLPCWNTKLKATYQDGVLNVPGGQTPNTQQHGRNLMATTGMQMEALVLAMGCRESVLIKGANLHEVADPQPFSVGGRSVS